MIRVIPGPEGRQILAKWSEPWSTTSGQAGGGGWSLSWRSTGEPIQDEILFIDHLIEVLQDTLPESVRQDVIEHEARLERATG